MYDLYFQANQPNPVANAICLFVLAIVLFIFVGGIGKELYKSATGSTKL